MRSARLPGISGPRSAAGAWRGRRRRPRGSRGWRRPRPAGGPRGRAGRGGCWPGGAQRLLDEAVGDGRALGELAGARGDGRGEVGVGDRLPDHAPVGGVAGRDRLGEERGAHRAGETDLAGQPVGAAGVGDQADAGEGLEEDRGLGGDDHVAGEREVGAGAGGGAVDGGDGRDRAVVEGGEQGLVLVAQRPLDVRRDVLGEVLAGAEAGAGAGEDEDAALPRGAGDGVAKGKAERRVEAVADFGAVQGDGRDPGVEGVADRLGGHGRPPSARRAGSVGPPPGATVSRG